jgi:manganese/zinc/iron transport system permease protein
MELSFTARTVLLGSTLLGTLGGVLGCFALLRRQSLLGDALAHAALPGVCLAFLWTGSKDPLPLALGALIAGLVGAMVILGVVRWSRIKEDSSIGIVLSVFFGLGIVLLTYIQRLPSGNQSGLDKYLFGQAATLMERDLAVMAILATIVAVTLALFYKELGLVTFDRDFAASTGMPVRGLEVLLTVLLVLVVVVGLQTVGVVLIVATLITPAAAARQWTDSLSVMLLLAGVIGGTSGAAGALGSASASNLPTGPLIVLVASLVLLVSILFAPRRGLVQAHLREHRVRRRIRRENLLKDLPRRRGRPGSRAGVAPAGDAPPPDGAPGPGARARGEDRPAPPLRGPAGAPRRRPGPDLGGAERGGLGGAQAPPLGALPHPAPGARPRPRPP